MLKKLKKAMLLVAGISLLAFSVASCNNGSNSVDPEDNPNNQEGTSDPGSNQGSQQQDPENPPVDPDKDAIILDATSAAATGGWAYITYSLADYAGKKVKVSFSCDMKVENAADAGSLLQWQINSSDYPTIVSRNFTPADKDYVTLSGEYELESVAATNVIYLSTFGLDAVKDNLKIYVKNLKWNASYSVEKEASQDDLEALTPSGWAYVTYSMSDYVGKKVIVNFSCEMKVENPDGVTFEADNGYKLKWQLNNNNTYPEIVTHVFTADETDFVKVEGSNAEPIEIANGALLYLSTNNETPNIKVYVKNIKYTVSYEESGVAEEEPEKIEYPTDIFTVGDAGSCGIVLRDGAKEAFTVFTEGSAAASFNTNADGSVTWIATAAGGGGGGVAFYVKSNKEEINFANYDSIDIELVYSPVTGAWNPKAQKPGFCMRILPWDSTGMFGGYEDLLYFDAPAEYGTLTQNIPITDKFVNKIKTSSDFDSILGFAIKFNDYNRGNDNGDQLKVQLKNVKFNAKANAAEDKAFDDGLTDAQRGKVEEINYPTRDWSVDADKVTDADKYNKHAWVYLPAGYDATDKETKYPVFILLHGFGQNENTWGLSDKGRGGKIKGYMDRGMASGKVEKFILVCATGVADKSWGPNGSGNSFSGYNYFGGELRNDLIPYLRANYNIAEGRDNVALAGLSMGGGQTFTIGIAQCLDLISNFAGFSGALFGTAEDFMAGVDGTAEFKDLKIHNLYMICGDNDSTVNRYDEKTGTYSFDNYIKAIKDWDRIENFESYIFPGGTHDFPVWYYGFNDFIHMVFQEGVQLYD